jgi:hypothetical protein
VIEIRSYRAVFDLERRIYRVDRLRLNPGGIPVRGVVYFLAILLTTLIAGRLPLVGEPIRALPWYLRDLALPIASATLLSVIRIEGRRFTWRRTRCCAIAPDRASSPVDVPAMRPARAGVQRRS